MFLHSYTPNPILLSLGPVQIHWYGFFVSLGIVLGLAISLKLINKHGLIKSKEYFYNLFFYSLISAIIGARLWHVAVEFDYYFVHLADIFKIWKGGLASHGAILGGVVSIWFISRHHAKDTQDQLSLAEVLDLITPGLALMHVFVRLGNYFNQELYGLPTSLPWGIPIAIQNRPPFFESYTYFHPTFLYEALFFLIIFTITLIIHYQKTRLDASIFAIYLLSYGIERFFIEFLRIDQSNLIFGLRLAQITSVLLVLIAIYILVNLKLLSKDRLNTKFKN